MVMQKQSIERLEQMLCEQLEMDNPTDAYKKAVRIGAVLDDERDYQDRIIEAVYTLRIIPAKYKQN